MDIKNYTGRRKFIMKNKLQAELMMATGKIIKKVVDNLITYKFSARQNNLVIYQTKICLPIGRSPIGKQI